MVSETDLAGGVPPGAVWVPWTQNGVEESYADGFKVWWLNGLFHRLDGPAAIFPDGYESWWCGGKRHRVGAPAVFNPDGTEEWWVYDIDVTPVATLLPDLLRLLGDDIVICAEANKGAIAKADAHRDPRRLRHDLGLPPTGPPTPEHVAAWHLVAALR